MFDDRHYVPVLKGKRAEFPAIEELKSQDRLTPLFEGVPSLDSDFIPKKMAAAWNTERAYFIDMIFLDDEDMSADESGNHPITRCFAEVANQNQLAIPVTGTARSPAYQNAVRSIVSHQQHGMAIRLIPADFGGDGELAELLDSLLALNELPPDLVDILIDLGGLPGIAPGTIAAMHRANVVALPNLQNWRSLTVISGAFPAGLANLIPGWNFLSRSDWLAWTLVRNHPQGVGRIPAFGDYTIGGPDLPHEGRATILAQLRYSIDSQFMVWKGRNVFTDSRRYAQFIDICADLIARPEYHGQNFSAGDQEIYEKATTGGNPGNAETWRRIGENHHVEKVIDQIANLP